jgi:putative transposase
VQLRYQYRLCPTSAQEAALARAFGCARVAFNDALRARKDALAAGQPYISDAEISARLTASKATPDRAWLAEVSAVVLQQALADLSAAYRNFFASVTGKRKGRKVARPRFGRARTVGRRSGSPRTHVSGSWEAGAFACRRSGTLRSAGRGTCRQARRLAKGSANREKARVRVARAHAKVADSRRDFHHKTSTAIIRDSQAVYVEDPTPRTC